jgi:apolipoprotein D and lipocalin family protein
MSKFLVAGALLLSCAGCATTSAPTIATAAPVDLERFMGDWYVLANIPTRIERGAHNALESYARDPDGTIRTTFTFRQGAFDGKPKRYEPRGWVRERSGNAVWGMQFIWPIKAEYVISWVDRDYTETIIGRSKRDYVWIMARTPTIPAQRYEALLQRAASLGYDRDRIQRVPQQWP